MLPDMQAGSNLLDPNLLITLNLNGGFGGNGNWMWVFFLFFLWPLMRGYGFGNDSSGFGPLSSQLNNDAGRELLMLAINRNGGAIDSLAQMFNCKSDTITLAINDVMTQVQNVGNLVGMSGMQIINAVLAGNTLLGQLIALCCCDNRLAICQLTNTILNSINNVAVGQERGFFLLILKFKNRLVIFRIVLKMLLLILLLNLKI